MDAFLGWIHYYPLWIFLPLWVVVLPVAEVLYNARSDAQREALRGRLVRIMFWVGAAGVASYVAILVFYWSSASYLDQGEVGFVATSYVVKTGHPLYHDPDAAARYSLVYGPVGYLCYAAWMALVGASFAACKAFAALCGVAFLGFTWLSLKTRTSPGSAFLWTALTLFLSLGHMWQTFFVKVDPILGLAAALALWAAVACPSWGAALLVGLMGGASVNMKLHGVLYLAYPWLLLVRRLGWQQGATSLVIAAVAAVAPWMLPNVSVTNWYGWISREGSHGFGEELKWTAQWAVFLLLFGAAPWVRQRMLGTSLAPPFAALERAALAALATSVVLVSIIASKVGSGPGHLVPFIPLLVYAVVDWLARIPAAKKSPKRGKKLPKRRWLPVAQSAVVAFSLSAVLLAASQEWRIVRQLEETNPISAAINADIADIMRQLPGQTIAMGYGATEYFFVTNHRLPLVLAGQPYWLDSSALMDYEASHTPIPAATRRLFSDHSVDVWLIPRDNPPFSMWNHFPPNRPVFDPAFRQAFLDHYQLGARSQFFDLYVAKPT